MKKRCFRFWPLLAICLIVALPSFADTKSYMPPPERGEIYVVIHYKRVALNAAGTTRVSVKWGRFDKTDSITPPKLATSRPLEAKGFVLRLSHKKNDSVRLTVETDGRIVNGPYQGNPPAEWNDKNYKQISW